MGSVLKKNQFDTFYHERQEHSLKCSFAIKKTGLNILKVTFPKRYGGNIEMVREKKELKIKKITKIMISEHKFKGSLKK